MSTLALEYGIVIYFQFIACVSVFFHVCITFRLIVNAFYH